MQWSVVVPGALIPAPIAADVVGAAQLPHWLAWTARAQVTAPQSASMASAGAAHLGWLWRRFSGRSDAAVTAPYAWRALVGTTPPAHLWQADPVHFAIARDHMLLATLGELTADEARALAAEAQPILATAGAQLHCHADHWFVSFERAWSLTVPALDAALGESVQHRLPEGADATPWRRLLTEIQIAWHHHPVNEAREERGAAEVNGLWLHGGGAADALPPSGLASVSATDPAVRGWALAAGVPAAALRDSDDPGQPAGDALIVWPHLFAAAKAEAWGAWLPVAARFDAWLGALNEQASQAGADVELVLCGRSHTRSACVARADRWKPWRALRRPPVLAEVLAEAVDA